MSHTCNAYCEGDLHSSVFSTPSEKNPWLRPGMRFLKGGQWAVIVEIEPASPEFVPNDGCPDSYKYHWLCLWRHADVPTQFVTVDPLPYLT